MNWRKLNSVESKIYRAERDIEKAILAKEKLKTTLRELCEFQYKKGTLREREALNDCRLPEVCKRLIFGIY